MPGHVDILDEPERLAKPFWSSLALHISAAGVVLLYGQLGLSSHNILMGDPNGGGFGSVAVNPTATIPLPPKSGPTNLVANDTQSQVPVPPPKAKPQPKQKAPDLDAIPLKSRNAKRREADKLWSQPNKWREAQTDAPNQLYSTSGQSLSSPMYNLPGGGGVGIGNNSPFGNQFGGYATILRDKVARAWNTADVGGRTGMPAVVTFTIRRDGSVPPQSVKVTQSSGNRALDFSAQRAVFDASPFGPLPPGFPLNQADVELRFELRR
jgi:protein TonB